MHSPTAAFPQNMIETAKLSNGLRIVCEPMPTARSVAVGVFIATGSRHERTHERGLSHFLEHMLFKGTSRRDALTIVREIEGRGGYINAETDKEYTAYYARVLPEDLSVAMDVLSDMLLASKLASEDIEREKLVVLEELREIMDYPDDYVHDLFARTLWGRHPLAHAVIGTPHSIRRFDQKMLRQALLERYVATNTVIAAVGQVQTEAFSELVEKYFAHMPICSANSFIRPPSAASSHRLLRRRTKQVHFCMGTAAFSLYDNRKYALAVLDMLLGGNMSSRLFQEVREKRGLVYHISTCSVSYREGGYFAVHANCSLENYSKVIDVTREELKRVCDGNLSEEEVQRAKHQLRGQLLISSESVNGRMSSYAKSLIFFNRIITVEELIAHIESVDAQQVLQVARALFGNGTMTLAAIGPFSKGEE